MYPDQNCTPCTNCEEQEPAVTSPPPCAGENCPEVAPSGCVKYTGPSYTCLGIVTGDSLDKVLAAIAAKLCASAGNTPTPVNCVVTAWGPWSACENGFRTRTRSIVVPAMNGGTACPALSETESCADTSCPTPTLTVTATSCTTLQVTSNHNASGTTITVQYKKATQSTWNTAGTITTSASGSNNLNIVNLLASTAYNVRIIRTCSVSSESIYVSANAITPACASCNSASNIVIS